MTEWRYYNHAAIPIKKPHEEVDLSQIKNGKIWKLKGFPLFARWTSDFDCGNETKWWYVIKDTPFDINLLKSKRRYEIKKGRKYFDIKVIDPKEFQKELFRVQSKAFSAWPSKYRPKVNYEEFKCQINNWSQLKVYGAFFRESGELCAFALIEEHNDFLAFSVLRADPEYERYGVNAAIVSGFIDDYNERLSPNFYICDGERSIRHETLFQDYLEKYFGFRKAYCHLNIKYRFPVGGIVTVLYPFRNIIPKGTKIGSVISAVLKMEEIKRDNSK